MTPKASVHPETIPLGDYDSLHSTLESDSAQESPHRRLVKSRGSSFTFSSWVDVDRLWISELSSCLISLACLAVMVVILRTHDEKPLPQWPHLITINSLLAIFTAVMKACMVMPVAQGISELKWLWFQKPRVLADLDKLDLASRGPWGAACLLFARNKHSIATLGALITVAALAIDPFSQQVVQYYNCLQEVPHAISRIPMTNNYTGDYGHVAAGKGVMDARMASAIYVGLLNPPANSSSSIRIDCQLGNCTFPHDSGATFSTLAVCHSCEDISNTITVYNNTVDDYNEGRNASIPSGPTTAWGYPNNVTSTAGFGAEDINGNWVFYQFEALMMRQTDFFATRCSIFPCVKTFGANMSVSMYNETLVSTDARQISLDYYMRSGSWGIATNQTMRNGTLHDCKPTDIRTESNTVLINATDNALASNSWSQDAASFTTRKPGLVWYPADCTWQVSWGAFLSIGQLFDELFYNQTVQVFYAEFNMSTGPPWLRRLYGNGTATMDSVNQYMEGLTNSMTSSIRVYGDTPSSDYPKGNVLASQTCVRVRWAWIGLPATLLFLTVVFVALVASQSAKHRWQGSWRASAVALLFHGFDVETRKRFGTVAGRNEMCKASEHVEVQLQKEQEGWKFVGVK